MLGTIVVNQEYEFTDELPKTRSAKIMHRISHTRELGLKKVGLVTL
jgi:acyl-coenzyme A synthetase/AMP-(fatty) acid ligase